MPFGLFLFFIILLTLFSAFFSGSETALFSLSPMTVKSYAHGTKRKRLIASLIAKPRELLVTLFICTTLTNILIQNLFSNQGGMDSSWLYRVIAPLIVTLFFGEILPKSTAFSNNIKIAHIVAPTIHIVAILLGPLRVVLTKVTSYATQVMFFFLKKEKEISKEELQQVLKTSEENKVLTSEEAELIEGYLSLQESTIKELMRPRQDVLYYEHDEPLSKLLHLFLNEQCSRLPVCSDGLDTVYGIITARHYLIHKHEIHDFETLKPYLQKPFFVPEGTMAKTLFRQFAQKGETLAIVVDEYGSITGLISREDLYETVIGEITDRRDQKKRYTRSGNDVIIASGKLELEEFDEIFNVSLPSQNNMITLGGWLVEQLGDIPKSGTKYTSNGFLFHVLAADPNRVRRIYVRKLKTSKNNGS